jgi:hypothetical protein
MKTRYSDILSRTSEKPEWWDDNGVPRYGAFHPDLAPNPYANEVVLYLIGCQACGTLFKVSRTWDKYSIDPVTGRAPPSLMIQDLYYGDPPNSGCCNAGPTMSSESLKVLEFWAREGGSWVRKRELEIDLEYA